MQNLDLDLVELLQLVTPRKYTNDSFYNVPRTDYQLWEPKEKQHGATNITKDLPAPFLHIPVSTFCRCLVNYYLAYNHHSRSLPIPTINGNIIIYLRAHVNTKVWPTEYYQDTIHSYARGNCYVWFTHKENK